SSRRPTPRAAMPWDRSVTRRHSACWRSTASGAAGSSVTAASSARSSASPRSPRAHRWPASTPTARSRGPTGRAGSTIRRWSSWRSAEPGVDASSHWSVLQLAEFVAAVATTADEDELFSAAVERVAEAVDAEVAALVDVDGSTVVSVGFGASVPQAELAAVVAGREHTLDVPGSGPSPALAVPVGSDAARALVLARCD